MAEANPPALKAPKAPPKKKPMNPDEIRRLLRKGQALTGEARNIEDKRAQVIQRRTGIYRVLRANGVLADDIADAWGVSRQALHTQDKETAPGPVLSPRALRAASTR